MPFGLCFTALCLTVLHYASLCCMVFTPLKTLNESNALNATFVAFATLCSAERCSTVLRCTGLSCALWFLHRITPC